jgi:hypothetical protein
MISITASHLSFWWKLLASKSCELCDYLTVVLPERRRLTYSQTRAHLTLAGMVFEATSRAGRGWTVYCELTLSGLQGPAVPEAAKTDWYRMCDKLTDCNLETASKAEPLASDGRVGHALA